MKFMYVVCCLDAGVNDDKEKKTDDAINWNEIVYAFELDEKEEEVTGLRQELEKRKKDIWELEKRLQKKSGYILKLERELRSEKNCNGALRKCIRRLSEVQADDSTRRISEETSVGSQDES